MKVGFGDDLKGEVGIDLSFDKLVSSGRTAVANGQVNDFEMNLDDLSGEATLQASIQALSNVAAAVSNQRLELPFGIEVPLLIGGIPFTLSLKTTIAVNLSLAMAGADLSGKAQFDFGGPAGLKYTGGQIAVLGQVVTDVPNLIDTVTKIASGPMGMVYTTELPKIGLGFGFANVATAKVYISNGAVVSFLVQPQPRLCSAMAVAHVVAVGTEANFLGVLSVELGRKAISDNRFNYQVPNEPYCRAQ
jgi:hypothetical protein